MDGYGQFCPVALAAEVFAERWTPLILRELLHGPKRFSDLHRGVPRMSRALLVQRLASLESAGVVERKGGRGADYALTAAGAEFRPVVEALGLWGYNWYARELDEGQVDPDHLMWVLRRNIRTDNLPAERVVVCFQFQQESRRRYWLVLQRPEADLCLFDPGHGLDLEVAGDARALAQIYLGLESVAGAVRSGRLRLSGLPRICRQFPSWLGTTHFAHPVQR